MRKKLDAPKQGANFPIEISLSLVLLLSRSPSFRAPELSLQLTSSMRGSRHAPRRARERTSRETALSRSFLKKIEQVETEERRRRGGKWLSLLVGVEEEKKITLFQGFLNSLCAFSPSCLLFRLRLSDCRHGLPVDERRPRSLSDSPLRQQRCLSGRLHCRRQRGRGGGDDVERRQSNHPRSRSPSSSWAPAVARQPSTLRPRRAPPSARGCASREYRSFRSLSLAILFFSGSANLGFWSNQEKTKKKTRPQHDTASPSSAPSRERPPSSSRRRAWPFCARCPRCPSPPSS